MSEIDKEQRAEIARNAARRHGLKALRARQFAELGTRLRGDTRAELEADADQFAEALARHLQAEGEPHRSMADLTPGTATPAGYRLRAASMDELIRNQAHYSNN